MAQTTLLEFAQQFCPSLGLPVPDALFGVDDNLNQVAAMFNRVADELLREKAWQINVQSTTFVSIAAEIQGSMQTLAPGYVKVLNRTFFDRTLRLPVFGPRSPEEWEQMKAIVNLGPIYQYRIFGGNMHILPVMEAGHTMAFEYQSKNLFLAADGTTTKHWATADDDTFLLDDDLLLKGVLWRWKYEKGMPYAEDKTSWLKAIRQALAADGTKRDLDLRGGQGDFRPGIFVPYGSFPVSN